MIGLLKRLFKPIGKQFGKFRAWTKRHNITPFNRGASKTHTGVRIALGSAFVLAMAVAAAAGEAPVWLRFLEHYGYDARLRLFAERTVHPRVVIIDIDEKSLREQGRFPWSRDRLELLMDKAFDHYGVAVMGIDFVFSEPDTSSGWNVLESLAADELKGQQGFTAKVATLKPTLDYDARFARAIQDRPVVLGFAWSETKERVGALPPPLFSLPEETAAQFEPIGLTVGYTANLPILQKAAPSGGHFAPVIDADGSIRRVPLIMRKDDEFHQSLALGVARVATGNFPIFPSTPVQHGSPAHLYFPSIGFLGKPIELDYKMSVHVPYRGPQGSIEYLSATDVMNMRLPKNALADKVVFLGTSAAGLRDLRLTPMGVDYPGVEVHANLAAGLLDGTIKAQLPNRVEANAAVMVILGLGLAILIPLLTPGSATALLLLVSGGFIGYVFHAWVNQNLILDMVAAVVTMIGVFLINAGYGFFTDWRTKRQMSVKLAAVKQEMEIGKRMQMSFLPSGVPDTEGRVNLASLMVPAKEVGGDFYDYFVAEPGKLSMVIADVSGKGVSAALFMAISRTLLRRIKKQVSDPADLICELNDQLATDNENMMFVTTFYGELNYQTGVFTYVNAGHNPPVLIKPDGTVEYFPLTKTMALAAMEGLPYNAETIQLAPGSTILYYTDGVTEAQNARGDLYGEDRLLATVRKLRVDVEMTEYTKAVLADVRLFERGAPQADDITCLAVRWVG
jgi:CHASE2 domain-containing sensor protein